MISDDIAVARELHRLAAGDPEVEAATSDLSIATFRFVPPDLAGDPGAEEYLNELNEELLDRLQRGGEAFVSNAVVDGRFLLRACVVNFRTSFRDVEAVLFIVKRLGAEIDATRRPPRNG
jgi:glutamate/tyrosine decarboxylase-like PLP-dependent enzyme